MFKKWGSCFKANKRLFALGLVSVLLVLSLFGLYRTTQALDDVIRYELHSLSSACDVVRQSVQDDCRYEVLARTFHASVWADLRALDHIAFRVPLYQAYALNKLEIFVMEMAGETDPEAQARNIETVCQVAEELDQVQEHLDFDYSLLTTRAKTEILPHLERIEQLCERSGT